LTSRFYHPPFSIIGAVPIDFILFALTLIGVAVFHHHSCRSH